MSELVSFLRTRLSEDDTRARAVGDACRAWRWEAPYQYPQRVYSEGVPILIAETFDGADVPTLAPFIAHQHPLRAVTSVEVRRRIVDLCRNVLLSRASGSDAGDLVADVLRHLASEYWDHPNFADRVMGMSADEFGESVRRANGQA